MGRFAVPYAYAYPVRIWDNKIIFEALKLILRQGSSSANMGFCSLLIGWIARLDWTHTCTIEHLNNIRACTNNC